LSRGYESGNAILFHSTDKLPNHRGHREEKINFSLCQYIRIYRRKNRKAWKKEKYFAGFAEIF